MGTAAGTAARQIVSRCVASSSSAAKGAARPVASLASPPSATSSITFMGMRRTEQHQLAGKKTTAPPPGPNSMLLEPTWPVPSIITTFASSPIHLPRAAFHHAPTLVPHPVHLAFRAAVQSIRTIKSPTSKRPPLVHSFTLAVHFPKP
ncbi:hypothetical protein JCM10908_007138 [Rhodotorula pacifica]|uniref:uncharacterized protein n=1 Tax=Rhodotorula pacifica TaxID=1495444 RepID=UPI00316D37DB